MTLHAPMYQVDSFATRLFEGNPAAVVVLGDEFWDDATMQRVAAENNLAETAFLVTAGSQRRLRWFTPTVEVPLCGHATLATGAVVLDRLEPQLDEVVFDSASGPLAVARSGDGYSMDLPAREASPTAPPDGLADALGERPDTVLQNEHNYLAVFDTAAKVRGLAPDMTEVARLDRLGVIVTAPGDSGFDFVSRYFAPAKGIPEDPVTGAAHCMLAPYWATRLNKTTFRAYQASPRGGEIACTLIQGRVSLHGCVVFYLEGRIAVRPAARRRGALPTPVPAQPVRLTRTSGGGPDGQPGLVHHPDRPPVRARGRSRGDRRTGPVQRRDRGRALHQPQHREVHIASLMSKIGARNRVEIAIWPTKQGACGPKHRHRRWRGSCPPAGVRAATASQAARAHTSPEEGIVMANPTRTTSVATGTLLILATVAAVAAAALDPTRTETLLLAAPGQPHRLALAAIFYLLAAAGSASIPIALYPLLQKIDAPFALASVVFRSIEAVFYTVAVVSLLSIPPLTTQPDSGGAPAQAIAGSLISLRDHANLAAIFAFCLGAWSYYYVLYRARMVPRWLSAWGVAGVLLMLAAAVFALFSNAPVTGYTVLILPIAVQEIALAVWLLIRGFDLRPHPVLARSESSSMPTTHPLDEHRIAQAP